MLDVHSHILPGLDDGASDLHTAIEMARIAVADGITGMVATPHFIEGSIEHNRELILQRVSDFQRVLDEQAINLKVFPGAEIFLSPETPERMLRGEVMTVNNGEKYLLVELPMQSMPKFTEEILFELKVRGVTPIIAHPERNLQLAGSPEMALELAAKGCLLQINAGSAMGLYGERVRKTAQLLIRNGLVHLIGSDAHSTGGRSPRIRESLAIAEKLRPQISLELIENGKKMLAGEDLNMEVPAEIRRSKMRFWERIKNVYSFGGVRS